MRILYKLSKLQKIILCYLGLVIAFILLGNSNNVPEIFAERIFKSIRGNNWSFNYSGLIVIVGIYYCLKILNEIKEKSLIKTTFRRIIVTIVLMNVFTGMWSYCIQFYKGFSNDLNSLYLDREKTSVDFNGSEDKITVDGTIDLKNCSNDTQKFHIKIKATSFVREDINEEYITLQNEFILYPKEEKTLFINEELKVDRVTQYSGYSCRTFEYIVFNDIDKVVFKGTLDDYQTDDLDL